MFLGFPALASAMRHTQSEVNHPEPFIPIDSLVPDHATEQEAMIWM